MISVVIPVHNVEKYISKCIDSVILQTYKNLDIILVDDGSTDGSGAICDKYAERDSRIRVFHTENRGLSAARNYALDNLLPESKWIAFIDSDDYIDSEMYEMLLQNSDGSDIVECGLIKDYKTHSKVESRAVGKFDTLDAYSLLLHGKLRNYVWNKIYRKELFEEIRFPLKKTYEDVSIQHRLVLESSSVTFIEGAYYHYVQRASSITNVHKLKYLIDRWDAFFERYEYSMSKPSIAQNKEDQRVLLKSLYSSAKLIWLWYYKNPKEERKKYLPRLKDIARFARRNFPLKGIDDKTFGEKLNGLFIHSGSRLSLALTYYIFHVYFSAVHKSDTDELFA